jgi:hypothetical protein
MHPAGVVPGIQSEAAQHEFSIAPESVEEIVMPSRALTGIERLEIYANAYYARLLECLREEFPGVRHAAGDAAFDAFAMGYLQECPSTSYTLSQLGGGFPKYLAATRPGRTLCDDDEPFAAWTEFLVDLATLERVYSEVFDGPGIEGQTLMDAAELAAISPDGWVNARLVPVCCLRLIPLRFPVHEYLAALKLKQEPSLPQPAETYLAVTRRDYVIRRIPLARPQFGLLTALVNGTPVGDAITQVAQEFGGRMDELTGSLRHWFTDWSAAGFFQSIVRS